MDNNIIMFNSVTLAMKSRNILIKYNVNSKVIRTPMNLRNKSCGYSLYVGKNLDKALSILRSNGVSVLGVAAVDRL